jgi:predicted Zn-ribbon and HTH transcriptional regulator
MLEIARRNMGKKSAKVKRVKQQLSEDARQHRYSGAMHPKGCVKCGVNFWSHDRYQLRCEKCQAALDVLIKRAKKKTGSGK